MVLGVTRDLLFIILKKKISTQGPDDCKKLWGEVPEWMIADKIILFCFGQNIPASQALAVRPRNIAIAEFDDKFVVSFLEALVEKANTKKIN